MCSLRRWASWESWTIWVSLNCHYLLGISKKNLAYSHRSLNFTEQIEHLHFVIFVWNSPIIVYCKRALRKKEIQSMVSRTSVSNSYGLVDNDIFVNVSRNVAIAKPPKIQLFTSHLQTTSTVSAPPPLPSIFRPSLISLLLLPPFPFLLPDRREEIQGMRRRRENHRRIHSRTTWYRSSCRRWIFWFNLNAIGWKFESL